MSNPKTPNPGSNHQAVKRPPCVLFSVKEANETDVAVLKKLGDAGCEIVVVQEHHFEEALKCIERVRRWPPNKSATKGQDHE